MPEDYDGPLWRSLLVGAVFLGVPLLLFWAADFRRRYRYLKSLPANFERLQGQYDRAINQAREREADLLAQLRQAQGDRDDSRAKPRVARRPSREGPDKKRVQP